MAPPFSYRVADHAHPIVKTLVAEAERRGLSIAAVSHMTRPRVHQVTIYHWMMGDRNPNHTSLVRVLDALGLEFVVKRKQGNDT